MRVAYEGLEPVVTDGLCRRVAEIKFRAGQFEFGEFGLESVIGLIVDAWCGVFIIKAIMLGDLCA